MLLNSKHHIDRRGAEVNMIKFTVQCYRNISQQLFYYIIADFIGLPYFSGFPSGLQSRVLISHDFLSQSKFVPEIEQPCA